MTDFVMAHTPRYCGCGRSLGTFTREDFLGGFLVAVCRSCGEAWSLDTGGAACRVRFADHEMVTTARRMARGDVARRRRGEGSR